MKIEWTEDKMSNLLEVIGHFINNNRVHDSDGILQLSRQDLTKLGIDIINIVEPELEKENELNIEAEECLHCLNTAEENGIQYEHRPVWENNQWICGNCNRNI